MWTTDDLLVIVKRKARLPSSNSSFSNAQLLSIADEELGSFFVPLLRNTKSDYWLETYDVTMTVGTASYRLPPRSTSASLVDVWYYPSAGIPWKLSRIGVEDQWMYTSNMTGAPRCYAINGDDVVLFPTPSMAYTLRIRYERRPSQLVLTTACGQVTAKTTTTLTVSGNTITASDTVDVIQATPDFDALIDSAAVTSTGSGPQTVTFTTSLSAVSVGDYVCQENTQCVVPLPDVWHYALAYRVAAQVLREKGDDIGADRILNDLDGRMDTMLASLQDRTNTDEPVLYNPNGPMRRGWAKYWRW
jgi:hypothetical protein